MHGRPRKISKLSSAGTVRFSTAMSWLPVPRSPLTDQVSRICAFDGANIIARASGAPGITPARGLPFSVTMQLPNSHGYAGIRWRIPIAR